MKTTPRRTRRLRWLIGLLLVLGLVAFAVLTVLGQAGRQQADDPRSSTSTGSGALGQLLRDEGVDLRTTNRVDDAVAQAGPSTTVVVAGADQLSAEEARRLTEAPAARLVLLRPNSVALGRFAVKAAGVAPVDGTFDPTCAVPATALAGAVSVDDMRAAYRATGPLEFACYPAGTGYVYLRARTDTGRPVELVAGGLSNDQLGLAGNSAFGLNVLGSQPNLVWLMGQSSADPEAGAERPTMLPGWWLLAVVQAILALVVVGIWRGRRLGPILSEALPVTVRASETVEGHGRLYYRLNARDRAAEALRAGARARLGKAFGHADDPLALSEVVGARTGRDPGQVRAVLYGGVPTTDDDLVELTRTLDRIEQEARQP
ncbi:MAG TPA: DUF4350 domain-containing protein [Propionibacteriaceae bacterium]